MPCIQIPIVNNQALLNILVFPRGSWSEAEYSVKPSGEQNIVFKDKQIIQCSAVIDTGATHSCIAKYVIEKPELDQFKSKEIREFSGASGKDLASIYNVDIFIGDINHAIQGVELQSIGLEENTTYTALIGMDIISKGTLHFNYKSPVSGRGICTFCL